MSRDSLLLKRLRHVTIIIILMNLPGFVLNYISPVLSSILSYGIYVLIIVYYLISKNWKFNILMFLFGMIFFGIASLSSQYYIPDAKAYIILIIKYFIIVICGFAMVKDTSIKELFYTLLIGASTVFLQIFIYYNPITDGGRYSGFYLNPNSLGFICMVGYGLTYSLNKKWRIVGQLVFTFVGILTFSRTFILVWVLMNLISIRLSIRNIRILIVGFILFLGLITYNQFLPKSNARLDTMSKILEGKSSNTDNLEKDGRTKTWANFYPYVINKPILGNGFGSFATNGIAGAVGAHNSYLKILGEGGIIPLVILLSLIFRIFIISWHHFLDKPHLFFITTAISLYILTNHNFFETPYLIFLIIWLQYKTFQIDEKSRLLNNQALN